MTLAAPSQKVWHLLHFKFTIIIALHYDYLLLNITRVGFTFFLGIGFTDSLSVVIIGHWSREQKLQKEHFNFSNDAARRNVLEFDSGSIKNNPCDQKLLSVKGLLSKPVSTLTYKQQALSNSSAVLPVLLVTNIYRIFYCPLFLIVMKLCHLCTENVYHLHSVVAFCGH